jgi:penicillin-binding protein 1A
VLSAEVSWLITDMLGDVLEWGTAKHIGAKLSRPAAAKTGTSQKRRDAWFVGYTPGLVTAVWVGNDTPRPLPGVGGTLAGPIWLQVMKQGLADEPVQGFERPPGLVKVKVCNSSGLLPKTHPETYEEWFVKGTEPAEPCPVEPEKNWWQRVMDYLRDRLKNRGQ